MFVAGHDTTANALSWIWYVLATYAEIRARLQAEVDSVLHGRTPTLEDLPQLRYVLKVINETLRVQPALAQVGPRRVLADTCPGSLLHSLRGDPLTGNAPAEPILVYAKQTGRYRQVQRGWEVWSVTGGLTNSAKC